MSAGLLSLTVEMGDPQGTLLWELEQREATVPSIGLTYAFLIAQEMSSADWAKVNAAIVKRWSPGALNRIKKIAWVHLNAWVEAANKK